MSSLSHSAKCKKSLTRLTLILIVCGLVIIANPVVAGRGDAVVRLSGRWIRYPREAYAMLSMVAMIFSKLSGIVAVIASALYARGKKAWSTSFSISLLIGVAGGFYAVRETTDAAYGFLKENSILLSMGGALLALIVWLMIVAINVEEKEAEPNELNTVVLCVHCGQKLRVKVGRSGYLKCPSCEHSFYHET